jgi:hypothetical protein
MQRHWVRCGPPAYMALALHLGLGAANRSTADRLDDPDGLLNFLRTFPGGAGA